MPFVHFRRNDFCLMIANLAVSWVDVCPLVAPGVGGFKGISRIALASRNEDSIIIDILYFQPVYRVDCPEELARS